MNAKITPVVAEVTHTEALQSGQNSNKAHSLSATQKSRVARFVKAHSNQHAADARNDKNIDQSNRASALAKPQVSAEEQAFAMSSRGLTRDNLPKQKVSPNVRRYQTMFTSDPLFLQKDMQSFEDSLRDKGLSLIDRSTKLNDQDKALRKYLLTEIILEEPNITPERKAIISQQRDYIKNEHGESILGKLSALDQAQSMNLSNISVREFVRAYSLLELPQADNKNAEIVELFKSIKPSMDKGNGTEQLVAMHNNFVEILKREKSQQPNRVTTPRQHAILSRLNQLSAIIKTQSLHKQFIRCCEKAKIKSLPKVSDLMDVCLQITVSNDMFAGVSTLIRSASAVQGLRAGAANMFVTNYNRQVLQSKLLHGMYKNNFHRKQVVDHLDKSMRTGGLFIAPKLKA
mgnify:FL=1